MPTIACRAKPSSSGSVTATTCITPASISLCTRWRTAASERPTTLPIAAYERGPSCWSCSMIALDTSSSWTALRPGFLTMRGIVYKRFRCEDVSYRLDRLFRALMHGTIRAFEPQATGGSRMAPESSGHRGGVSRRSLLKGGGVVAFGGLSLAALQLPFFAVSGAQQDPALCTATDRSAE